MKGPRRGGVERVAGEEMGGGNRRHFAGGEVERRPAASWLGRGEVGGRFIRLPWRGWVLIIF